MFGAIKSIFSGSGAIDSLEKVALEMIDTDKESAEAKAVMIKSLDPNGKMRKQISKDVFMLYKTYVFALIALITLEFFGFGVEYIQVLPDGSYLSPVSVATDKLKSLFEPLTMAVGLIIGASFGVNYANVKKGN